MTAEKHASDIRLNKKDIGHFGEPRPWVSCALLLSANSASILRIETHRLTRNNGRSPQSILTNSSTVEDAGIKIHGQI